MTVATATLNGGLMDASANSLVVSDRVKIGASFDATVSSGDTVAVSGADLIVERTMTLTNGTVTLASSAFPMSNLVGLWNFDETTGSTAADSSTGGNTGTLASFPTDDSQWVAGKVDGALRFYGANDVVNVVGYKGVTGTASRTTAAWIKTADNEGGVLTWGTDAGGQKWSFRTQSGNGTAGGIRTEVNGGYNVSTTNVSDDAWHHVVMVLTDDGTPSVDEMLVYVDGVLDGSSAKLAKAINTAVGADVRIGNNHSNVRFTGLMDQVAIWDRPLNATEIAMIYNGGAGSGASASGSVNQPETNVVFSANSTLILDTTADARLGDVTVAPGVTGTFTGGADLMFTNMTLGDDSMIRSTETVDVDIIPGIAVEVTVNGTLTAGNGISMVGSWDDDDQSTSLTLADGAVFDWTFSGVDNDFIDLAGYLAFGENVTINIIDGLGENTGDDVLLFITAEIDPLIPESTIDIPASLVINAPEGWTFGNLVQKDDTLVLENLVTGIVIVDGDADGDQDVDVDDLAIFKAQFGGEVSGLGDAEFDGDGIVTLADFAIMRGNWGATGSPPSVEDLSATPEPATMSLLALGGLLMIRRRRRKA